MTFEIGAPAKLNLYLHIVGRRADGFHELESLVAFTEHGDALRAAPSDALSLRLDGPFAETLRGTPDDDNLVLKAARRLADWARLQGGAVPGAALTLTKTLPVASGIGGGSSDAAAALKILSRLWALAVPADQLARMGGALGSDIPACIVAEAALMEGLGERLSAVPPLPAAPVLLVNPGVPVPTPAVYRGFRDGFAIKPGPRAKPVGPFGSVEALASALAATENDLEGPAIALCPQIGTVLRALTDAGALLARMSGSGGTCFALYDGDAEAAAAAARLKAAQPQWWVMATRLRSGP